MSSEQQETIERTEHQAGSQAPTKRRGEAADRDGRESMPVANDLSDSATSEPKRERFRSWVTDTARGYSRMTDDQYQMLILQFEQKPSPEILSALKDAGFHFHADYSGHNNAWVRRNDYSGRIQVDAIERMVKSQSTVSETPER